MITCLEGGGQSPPRVSIAVGVSAYRRLRFIANNQRFCVLPAGGYRNVASAVLSASLRRLAADWQVAWGHPVVAVETFTDPAKHMDTCYRATNFALLG